MTTKVSPSLLQTPFRKNVLINGNFDVWQRGNAFSSPAHLAFFADRWRVQDNGSGSWQSANQVQFAAGQDGIAFPAKYFVRLDVNVAGDLGISNRIEDVRTINGQNAILTFWMRGETATVVEFAHLRQYFGSGGSPSSDVLTNFAFDSGSISTSWQKFRAVISVPSIAGKTIGSNGDDYLDFRLDVAETYSGYIDLAQVQLEVGSAATDFEYRTYQDELALCQRYCYRMAPGSGNNYALGQAISATDARTPITYPVTMRTTPTFTSGGSFDMTTAAGGSQAVTGISNSSANMHTSVISTTTAAGLAAGDATRLNDSGGASYVQFEAEL